MGRTIIPGWSCTRFDCKYRGYGNNQTGGDGVQTANGCDYISITGKSRIKDLPQERLAPALCDKYEPGERKKQVRAKRNIVHVDYEKVEELYKAGKTDTEICLALKVPRTRIVQWRRSHNLKPNGGTGIAVPNAKWSKALELYQQGCSDRNIAAVIGTTAHIVACWRRRKGLPPNVKDTSERDRKIRALYDEGKTDFEIGPEVGLSSETIRRWRSARNLPANKRPHCKFDLDKLRELHAQGFMDREIGELLGATESAINVQRRKLGLPSSYETGKRSRNRPVQEVQDGYRYEEELGLYLVFVGGVLRAASKEQVEAARLYEEVRK